MEKQDRLGMSEQRRRAESLLLHKGMIASLLLVLMLMLLARRIPVQTGMFGEMDADKLQALNLEVIMLEKPPPPPPPKTIQQAPPITIQKKPDEVPDKITQPIKPVRERRRVEDHKVDFSLTDQSSTLLADASALGSISGPDGRGSRMDFFDSGPSLSLDAGGAVTASAEPVGMSLDVDLPETRSSAPPAIAEPELSLKVPEEPARPAEPQEKKRTSAGVIDANVSVVLASTDISAGTEEYQLWNRINAEFDRWDKGRYGTFPQQLQRRGRSIIANFVYHDGTGHRIVWRRGNTKIYVQGKSKRVRLMELKQAVAAMIQLNINKSE